MIQLPDRYCNYRREWDAGRKKWNKIPCDASGRNIDAHNPANWRTHVDAERAATWDEARPGAPYGIAWVISRDDDMRTYDDGLSWFLLDLDDALESDNRTWKAEADLLFRSFGGALGEVSSSGNGLHILGRCRAEAVSDRRNKWGGDREFYFDRRFVALSRGGLTRIRGGDDSETDWTDTLLRVVPQREFAGDLPDGRDPEWDGPEDDDELIAMMLRSRPSVSAAFGEGVTVRQLWEGDAAALCDKYPDPVRAFDHSGADMALMTHLAFWTGKDLPRMERLFRRSALMRDKWSKREDYRRSTVQGAARMCKSVLRRRTSSPPTGEAVMAQEGDPYLTLQGMVDLLKGCVYVQNMHRVLVPSGMLMRPEQFRAAYGGYVYPMMADGTKPTRSAFEALTECTIHRFTQAETICFYPDRPYQEIVDGAVNTFKPINVPTREGDASPFLDLVARLYPDETDRAILLSWMCFVVQNPGRKALWAPVLQGAEGNGKSMISEVLVRAIGETYCHTVRAKDMSSQFNGWQAGKMLIVVPEVHMGGRREILDDLKPNITDARMPIRLMGVQEQNMHCPTNWIFMSNHRDAVIKSQSDRRYAVMYSAQQTGDDVARAFESGYFPKMWDWLRAEGFEIMAKWLRETPADPRFDPAGSCHRAPETSSTAGAVAATMGSIEAEIIEAIESGRVGFRGGWVSSYHLSAMLRDAGIRVARPKLGQIMRDLGYRPSGRAARDIIAEGRTRPSLWASGAGVSGEYIDCQGDGYA